MNHDKDYDRDHDQEDAINDQALKEKLKHSLETENEMMREYLSTAEKVHDNQELKERLENFSEGNAKRSKQLDDELNKF